jgi:2-polyprenyl-3-methyl-5-hydroxy-6-metoxy-1,4-benzoquinol methylase
MNDTRTYYGNVNPDLLKVIPMSCRTFLELGCGTGRFGEAVKRRLPTAVYHGVELNADAGSEATYRLDEVLIGNAEDPDFPEQLDRLRQNLRYDCFIFGDVLEHLKDPWAVLQQLAAHATEDAMLVACIPNVSHWSLIQKQLAGDWQYQEQGLLDRTHLRFFTLDSVIAMLRETGWHIVDAEPRLLWPDQTRKALDILEPAAREMGIDPQRFRRNTAPFQWVVRARRTPVTNRLTIAALGLRHKGGEGVARVRTDHPLAALNSLPDVNAVWKSEELVIPKGFKPDILILQRSFLDSPALQAKVEEKCAQGTIVISDYDDDPRHWPQNEAANFRAFKGVHAVTVSTEPLAELVRQWNPNVHVFPNAVFELPAISPTTPKQGERLRIFFGALNRSEDWADIEDPVINALRELGDRAELVIVHDREAYERLPKDIDAEFHPTLPHSRYMEVLASCDIGLLPLRDTEFNRFKSDIKFIECCAAGVVPIFSPTVYAERPEHLEIGIKAETSNEWESALTQLATDPVEIRLRRTLGVGYASHDRMQSQQAQGRFVFYEGLRASRAALEQDRQARLKSV